MSISTACIYLLRFSMQYIMELEAGHKIMTVITVMLPQPMETETTVTTTKKISTVDA